MCFVSHENSPICSGLRAVCTQTETRREISQRHTQSRPPVHTNSSTDTQIYIHILLCCDSNSLLASFDQRYMHYMYLESSLTQPTHYTEL